MTLDDATDESIRRVVERFRKPLSRGKIGPGKIVSELTFGTSVMLLGRGGSSILGRTVDYETRLWRPALRLGFSRGTHTPAGHLRRPPHSDVYTRASNLSRFRNRVAHHEPPFNGVKVRGTTTMVDVTTLWDEPLQLLGWMSPELEALHRADNRVPLLLAARP